MEELIKRLIYDQATGHLIWKDGQCEGQRADRPYTNGYRCVYHYDAGVKRKYRAHRLIWLMHHGTVDGEIDHINRDRADNRIENLRVCDRSANLSNQLRISVKKVERMSKTVYVGRYRLKGKEYHTGVSECPLEAGLTVVRAKRERGLLPAVA